MFYRASVIKHCDNNYIVVRRAYGKTPEEAWENLSRIFPTPTEMPQLGERVESGGLIYSIRKVDTLELMIRINEELCYLSTLWHVLYDKAGELGKAERGESDD
jgi:hypothetical protein